ncbi:hypothetical protein LXL04_004808 [Taraxacum kok-saghyz]
MVRGCDRMCKQESRRMARILGCLEGSFPFKHLGVPVGANMGLKKNWQPIVDKFKTKLSSWKANALSFAGRLSLIKSVMSNLPTYFMSLFKAPQGIIDTLEKLRRLFLWGDVGGKAKIHWVDWAKIVTDKKDGGLGVGTLKAQNIALLTKWWWRLINDNENSFWKKIIVSIHNLRKKPASYISKKSSTGVWCNIHTAVNYLNDINLDVNKLFRLIPGTSVDILFWKDPWCGESTFQSRFPALYKLDKRKNCSLTDRLSREGFAWDWKQEPRDANSLNELLQLYSTIRELEVGAKKKFGFAFLADEHGNYTVKTLRNLIDSKLIFAKGPVTCWANTIPLKVRCFVWRASMKRIPVAGELAARGIMVQNQVCHLCRQKLETIDHLFTGCNYTKHVMSWIFKWCGMDTPHFDNISNFLDYAASWGHCPRKRTIFITIMYCLMWCTWLERNVLAFNNKRETATKVADNIMTLSFLWYINRSKNSGEAMRNYEKEKKKRNIRKKKGEGGVRGNNNRRSFPFLPSEFSLQLLILGYAYPAFECFKTMEKHGVENGELRFWCQYWVIVAILTVFERIGDIFISWVPMYGEMKLALIIYLWYPKTKGSWYVYEAMLRPFVERHETDIETSLKELRSKAWDVAIYYWHNSTELGQTKFFDIFHYLVSKPSRPELLQNHGNSGEGRPPPPPVTPASFFRSEDADQRWTPTAPPAPASPNTSRHHPVYAEELHLPPSPSRSGSNSGHREPVWLRFRRSRGL